MRRLLLIFGLVLLLESFAGNCSAQDVVELMTGVKLDGKVTAIDKTKKVVTFSANIGGQTVERTYPYDKIHAVTYQGRRHVLTAKGQASPGSTPADAKNKGAGNQPLRRTPAEVKAIIEQAGKSPPDWYDTVPLEHPPTLDLSWPTAPPKGNWNHQKNVGQYLWDIIYPNPNKWKSGVRLIHHLAERNKDDAERQQHAMKTLGTIYFNLFQDYARAAYWWQKAGVRGADPNAIELAECFWRLGDRKTAEEFLADPDRPRANKPLQVTMIKLWGDMGETSKAVKFADWYVKAGGQAHLAYLLAADACRLAGRYQEAIKYYQKTVDAPGDGKQGRIDQTKQRAQNSLEAMKLLELLDVSRVADGKYRNSSRGYEGPVEVEVSVAGGRIDSVKVTQHKEKQFYSALTDVPNQIIKKQGVKGVDATSNATITAEAIINATAKALSK